MALNYTPKYQSGNNILVPDSDYRDEWLLDRFSAQQLYDAPERIEQMSVRMCDLFHDYYKGRRILPKAHKKDPSVSMSGIKTLVRERSRLIKKTRTQFDAGRKKFTLLSQYCDELNNLADRIAQRPGNKLLELDVHGSKNRNTLYDFAPVCTGLYSVAALDALERDSTTQVTEEHFFPRTAFATRLAEQVVKGRLDDNTYVMTEADMLPLIYNSAFVSIVLPSENRHLIKFQSSANFDSPAKAYEQAGIQVIDTGNVVVHHTWNTMAKMLDVDLRMPTLADFDYDITQ